MELNCRGDGVILQRERTQILAVAGFAHAAVRHLVHQHEMAIHPGAAIMQSGDANFIALPTSFDQTDEARPYSESIGPVERLFLVLETRHGDHRAEHFALHDLVGLQRVGDHGRLVEEALAAGACPPATTSVCRAPRRARRRLATRLCWRCGDQRPDLVFLILVAAERDAATAARARRRACRRSRRPHRRGRRRCNPARHCNSRTCAAPSTTASISASASTITGALPPQFQMRALDRFAGRGSTFCRCRCRR